MTTLNKLNREFIWCRDTRHCWVNPVNTVEGAGKSRLFTRTLTCMRCGTERHETISLTTFLVLSRSYTYPEDYLLSDKSTYQQVRERSIRLQLKELKS